jgi:superfamily II DNA or RNA helicase
MQSKASLGIAVPSPHNWRTTDEDEINRRRARARTEEFRVSNIDPRHPIFSNFRVNSGSGLTYSVEIRDVRRRHFACDCVDFRINGLGTCKHIEAVLLHLQGRFKRLFQAAAKGSSPRLDVVPDAQTGSIRLVKGEGPLRPVLREWFDEDGALCAGLPEEAIEALRQLGADKVPELRLSQELEVWLQGRRRAEERKRLRREYEIKVQSGEWPLHETKVPLFPYQREGMLHLAFTERALLADEMGLGKTIQAIAACALLRRLGQANRVLVVTPASLKTEWEEQIQRFTALPYQLVFGGRMKRLRAYDAAGPRNGQPTPSAVPVFRPELKPGDGQALAPSMGLAPAAPFFTMVNYEQMLADSLEVNQRLQPDVVVLDEAQRIKNWGTKTTQAVKRLRSRYAFVLTGTPIENRIDEIHSLMDFLEPSVLGPLFRFNRQFYELDDRGRPVGYRNLDKLHEGIRPFMLRRRKADVETELPPRSDRNFFVALSAEQQGEYESHEGVVARLAAIAKRRPLTQQEQDKLMRHLAMMRMVCDTNYILDPAQRACPKLAELEKLLEECRDNLDVKVLVFSEWERMLELVRGLCDQLRLGFAWHTGTVPQRRRRVEINAFKSDPNCRVFLSTDSGAAGLNLQAASVVINCDLPWNPARLEQRIARAWRKHQTRSVTVVNLVSENTIEQRMLQTLSLKQALADGVLERKGNLKELKLTSGRQAFLAKLQQLVTPATAPKPGLPETKPPLPADRPRGFAAAAQQRLDGALLRCEERFPNDGPHSVIYVVVERDAPQSRDRLAAMHDEYFGPGRWDPLAPAKLEVVDRATDEALQRLIDAGLLARTMRASRPLWPPEPSQAAPSPLCPAEMEKLAASRQLAARKLKMARVLDQAGLDQEARAALLEGLLPLGCALAVENRLPEPAALKDLLLPPISHCWQEALSLLRDFSASPAHPCQPVIEALGKFEVTA